jgi:hypothetical protein
MQVISARIQNSRGPGRPNRKFAAAQNPSPVRTCVSQRAKMAVTSTRERASSKLALFRQFSFRGLASPPVRRLHQNITLAFNHIHRTLVRFRPRVWQIETRKASCGTKSPGDESDRPKMTSKKIPRLPTSHSPPDRPASGKPDLPPSEVVRYGSACEPCVT